MAKHITDFNFHNKYVLVRTDFNVPLKNGKVADDFRLRAALKTLRFLKNEGAQVVVCSHFGNPDPSDKKSKKEFSLEIVKKPLEKLLNQKIGFLKEEDILSRNYVKKVKKIKSGEIVLMENLRFFPGEKTSDMEFAKALSLPFDCFVNEAFSVVHRPHASLVLLPKLLESFLGFQFQKEIDNLSPLRKSPRRPFTVLIGGAKIESKIKALSEFMNRADFVLVGGKIANIMLSVKGIVIGRPWPSEDVVQIIKKINLADPRLRLPVDVLVSPRDPESEPYVRESAPGKVLKEEDIFDIGPETVKTFQEIIKKSKTVVWAGPMGAFEDRRFAEGTEKIAKTITEEFSGFSVVGGGDTINALRSMGRIDEISFVSLGGGAMLKFLAGENLPGIEAMGINV